MYQRRTKVAYCDCDSANRLKLSAAMRQMQQTSSEQLELLGLSPEKLFSEDMVFLLAKTNIRIHRMPVCTQEIAVKTAAIATRGARFIREFAICSLEGEPLVSASTLWVLADTQYHKVLRPSKFPYPLPFEPSIIAGAVEDIPLPKVAGGGGTSLLDIQIGYSHLDVNRHVTNSIYGDFVCDALPFEKMDKQGLDTVAIAFQREAIRGQTLRVTAAALNEKEYRMIGCQGDTPCFEAYARLAGS